MRYIYIYIAVILKRCTGINCYWKFRSLGQTEAASGGKLTPFYGNGDFFFWARCTLKLQRTDLCFAKFDAEQTKTKTMQYENQNNAIWKLTNRKKSPPSMWKTSRSLHLGIYDFLDSAPDHGINFRRNFSNKNNFPCIEHNTSLM